jgi:hypothetical protein
MPVAWQETGAEMSASTSASDHPVNLGLGYLQVIHILFTELLTS